MLVDTSIWIDHLRRGSSGLANHLETGDVECHPFVVGELACGNLRQRAEILSLLGALPRVIEADQCEVLSLLDSEGLHGNGLGWIDVHLLASTILSRTTIWTKDRRLAEHARRLEVSFEPG